MCIRMTDSRAGIPSCSNERLGDSRCGGRSLMRTEIPLQRSVFALARTSAARTTQTDRALVATSPFAQRIAPKRGGGWASRRWRGASSAISAFGEPAGRPHNDETVAAGPARRACSARPAGATRGPIGGKWRANAPFSGSFERTEARPGWFARTWGGRGLAAPLRNASPANRRFFAQPPAYAACCGNGRANGVRSGRFIHPRRAFLI